MTFKSVWVSQIEYEKWQPVKTAKVIFDIFFLVGAGGGFHEFPYQRSYQDEFFRHDRGEIRENYLET